MGRPRGWTTAVTGRLAMRSPGQSPVARRAHGATSEMAVVEAGVSPAVGSRWFREAGGVSSLSLQFNRRPHSLLGHVPLVEYEAAYYAQRQPCHR